MMTYHSWFLPSNLTEVDTVCPIVRKLLESDGELETVFTAELLLREFVNNAIIHGNGSDSRKRVRVVIRVSRKWIVLWISDEGPGFDWQAKARVPPDGTAVSGRGLVIGALYADRMRFNPAGNQVTLRIRKKKQKETTSMKEYEIAREGIQARILLGEKLTAANVPVLQPDLKEEIGSGVREIVFDLIRTESIDSTGIGLLIATHNTLMPMQGAIRLINLSPGIMKLFRSMRLADRLHATAVGEGGAHG